MAEIAGRSTALLDDDPVRCCVVRERDAFGAALSAIRERLRGGRYPPSHQLLIGDLASGLRLSSTPIREALARLAGEGLIEDRRGNGYFARRLDVAEILELYAMHEVLVTAALRRGRDVGVPAGPSMRVDAPIDIRDDPAAVVEVEAIFDPVVRRTGDRVLGDSYAAVRDRLVPVRRAEPLFLPAIEPDLAALAAAIGSNSPDAEARLADYHHQRRSLAQGLARHFRAQSGYGG